MAATKAIAFPNYTQIPRRLSVAAWRAIRAGSLVDFDFFVCLKHAGGFNHNVYIQIFPRQKRGVFLLNEQCLQISYLQESLIAFSHGFYFFIKMLI